MAAAVTLAADVTRYAPQDLLRASKELGMGQPPPRDHHAAEEALAALIYGEHSRFDLVESSEWTLQFPMLDANVGQVFGPSIDVFSTPNGQPPPGVLGAFNTLSVPGMPNSNMLVWGLMVRISVEAEGRLIRANLQIPIAGQANPSASPDVFDTVDIAAGIFGTVGGTSCNTPIPAELSFGTPGWKFAYDLALGYELDFLKEHQVSLIRQPLKTLAMITPFASAEAAGLAYGSNIDRVRAWNDRVAALAQTAAVGVLSPITHKRIGVFAGYAAGATGGDFPPTREEDASPTMFGALGMPHSHFTPSPLLFTSPMWWPRGAPVSIKFNVLGQAGVPYQTDMQRQAGLTGGFNGAAGTDLNLPLSAVLGGNTLAGPVEQSLDAIPTAQAVIVNTNRALAKFANVSILVGLIGKRVPPAWHHCIARQIGCGAIQMPHGAGDIGHLIGA